MSDVMLYLGDCLEIMPTLPAHSVDAIITDLPYGTTACKWDVVIPFEPMWAQVKRLLKPRGVFVTTASQPFTSLLVCSNLSWFKYCWVWEKVDPNGFLNANYRPLQKAEDIVVFSPAGSGAGSKNCIVMTYNPQGIKEINKPQRNRPFGRGFQIVANTTPNNSVNSDRPYVQRFTGYPSNVLVFDHDTNKIHPTQKPVALYEYLIRTYTNEGDTVMDFCIGSGTTGKACIKTLRNFIGIEKDAGYFEIAKREIEKAQMQPALLHERQLAQAEAE